MIHFPAESLPKGEPENRTLNAVGPLDFLADPFRAMAAASSSQPLVGTPSAGNYSSPALIRVKDEMVDAETAEDKRLRKLRAASTKKGGDWVSTLAQLVILLCAVAYPDKAELMRSAIASSGLDVILLADKFTGIEHFVNSTRLKDGSFGYACESKAQISTPLQPAWQLEMIGDSTTYTVSKSKASFSDLVTEVAEYLHIPLANVKGKIMPGCGIDEIIDALETCDS